MKNWWAEVAALQYLHGLLSVSLFDRVSVHVCHPEINVLKVMYVCVHVIIGHRCNHA